MTSSRGDADVPLVGPLSTTRQFAFVARVTNLGAGPIAAKQGVKDSTLRLDGQRLGVRPRCMGETVRVRRLTRDLEPCGPEGRASSRRRTRLNLGSSASVAEIPGTSHSPSRPRSFPSMRARADDHRVPRINRDRAPFLASRRLPRSPIDFAARAVGIACRPTHPRGRAMARKYSPFQCERTRV